jgi:hypothetical protein
MYHSVHTYIAICLKSQSFHKYYSRYIVTFEELSRRGTYQINQYWTLFYSLHSDSEDCRPKRECRKFAHRHLDNIPSHHSFTLPLTIADLCC